MAIALGDNIQTGAPKPTDSRYLNNQVPYTGETEVNTLITGGVGGVRYTGLTVNIGGTEYWYKEGIGDEDLIEKTSSGGGSSNLAWTGSTANAIGTYMSVSGICAQSGLTFDGTTLSVSGAIDAESTLDILGATCLHDTLAVTGATSLSAVASYLSDLSPFTARQIPDAEWVTGQTNAVCLGWSNLISGSTVAGCGTIASGSSCCNTFYGVCAGASMTTGYRNVLIGFCAGTNITQGHGNVLQGLCAGATMSTAFDNTGIGINSLYDTTIGYRNTAIGANTLIDNISGCHNSAVGTYALVANTTGCHNVGTGYYSLRYNTSGDFNTGTGVNSLFWNGTGNRNTAMGAQSLYNATGSGNVALGYGAGSGQTSVNNKLYIANCRYCSLISGDFAAKTVTIDNKLITTDFQMTNGGASGCVLTSDASGNATWATPTTGTSYWQKSGAVLSPVTYYDNVQISQNECFQWTGGAYMHSITGGTNQSSWCVDTACSCITMSLSGSIALIGSSVGIINTAGTGAVSIQPTGCICTVTNCQKIGIDAGESTTAVQAGCAIFEGGRNTSTGLGGHTCICGGRSLNGIGGNLVFHAGVGSGGTTNGRVMIDNLPVQTSETDVVYIDGSGNLSCGATSGGGGIVMSGDTVDGLTTYVDATTICAQSGLTFDGTTLTTPSLIVEDLTDGYIPYQKAVDDKLSNSIIYYGGTNVGIGTTTPNYKLQLNGVATNWATSPSIVFRDTTGEADSRTWLIGGVATNYGDLNFAVSTTNADAPENSKMTISKDGNVGIGTAAPGAQLHIESATPDLWIKTNVADNDIKVGEIRFIADVDARNARIEGYRGSSSEKMSLKFFTYKESEAVEAMIINDLGNVGIGTATPGLKLDIQIPDASNNGIRLSPASAVDATHIMWDLSRRSNNEDLWIYGYNGTNFKNFVQFDWSTGYLSFLAGNVGIGTATPATKLSVSQAAESGIIELMLGTNAYNARDAIFRKDTTTPWYFDIIGAASTSTDAGAIRFFTSDRAAGEKMRIDAAGKVGIGTDDPEATLQVQETTAGIPYIFRLRNNTAVAADLGSGMLFQAGTAGNGLAAIKAAFTTSATTGGGYLTLSTRQVTTGTMTERIRIDQLGNVGIGTDAPDAKLDIEGAIIYGTGVVKSGFDNAQYYVSATVKSELLFNGVSLDFEHAYKVTLATRVTGSVTGYRALIYSADGVNWTIREVSYDAKTSNSPFLEDDAGTIKVLTAHAGQYYVVATIEAIEGGTGDDVQIGGADSMWQRVGTDVYYNDGKVGIGTAAPSVKLHINDTVTTINDTTLLKIRSAASSGGGVLLATDFISFAGALDEESAKIGFHHNDGTNRQTALSFWTRPNQVAAVEAMRIDPDGNVGIGTDDPNYLLELSGDSAGKPGAGGLWTIVSDQRLKDDIVLADLDRSYEIVKELPLKRFTWKDSVYTQKQVHDRSSLGWIADDVQQVFPKAVNIKPFTLNTKTPDGTEEYQEQDYIVETGIITTTEIVVISGTPTQITNTGITENKVLLFDDIEVKDISGNTVYTDKNVETTDASGNTITIIENIPLTHQMPRMVTKTRDKFIQDSIPDALNLNTGQIHAAMYGALQKTMMLLEDALERIEKLEGN